jgi:hypothetical protein
MKKLTLFSTFIALNFCLFAQARLVESPIISVPSEYNRTNLKLITIDLNKNGSKDLIYNLNNENETLFCQKINKGDNSFSDAILLFKVPILDPNDTVNTTPNQLIANYTMADYDKDEDLDFIVLIENEKSSYINVYLNDNGKFEKGIKVFEFNRKNLDITSFEAFSFDTQKDIYVLKDEAIDVLILLKKNPNSLDMYQLGEFKNFKSSKYIILDYDYDYDLDILLDYNATTQKIRTYSYDKHQFSYKEVAIGNIDQQDYNIFNVSDLFGYNNHILAIAPKKSTSNGTYLPGYIINMRQPTDEFTILDTIYLKPPTLNNTALAKNMQLEGVAFSNTNLCDIIQFTDNQIFFIKNKYGKSLEKGEVSHFEYPKAIPLPELFNTNVFSIELVGNLNYGNSEIIIKQGDENLLQYFLLTTEE